MASSNMKRRKFLRGIGLGGLAVRVGLPALECMFNSNGTAYAATPRSGATEIPKRFVLWFNGNGISERYWIPRETGEDYAITPCLQPLSKLKEYVHVISGLDSPAARLPGPGNDHHRSMSALMSGLSFSGRGAGGPSFDQVVAQKIGQDTRFKSLQIGVCQESFGESVQRNMSWAERDRPLPPEMLPHRLFDRVFGSRGTQWVDRKKSILDAVRSDAESLSQELPAGDRARVEEYLESVRDLERSIEGLPAEYRDVVERPPEGGDLKDWPRIAKLQTDLLVHALRTDQTRVASYMLTKCQGLSRFPWLGHTAYRHHEYTHGTVTTPRGIRILRDINRWHIEEFAYLLAKLRSIPEGDGTLLDHTLLTLVHEHAEANSHKNSGLAVLVAGGAPELKTGRHTNVTGTIGDLYWTLGAELLKTDLSTFPSANRKLHEIV